MPIRLDPEEAETAALFDFTGSFAGRRVLEIGSGDGRLTWRYANHAGSVLGLEPDPVRYGRALPARPPRLVERVEFRNEALEAFAEARATRRGEFDLAILAWSL